MTKKSCLQDMPEERVDLSPLFKKYNGKWVALSEFTPEYKVVSWGSDVKTVHNRAIKRGYKNAVMFKAAPSLINAIF